MSSEIIRDVTISANLHYTRKYIGTMNPEKIDAA